MTEVDGTTSIHADLRDLATGDLNDLVVDANGRAYVGNFGFDMSQDEAFTTASLHRVDPDGSISEVATGLHFPNGCVITNRRTLLVNETFGNRITAFDLTSGGDLVNRRTWATFGPVPTGQKLSDILTQVVVAADGSCLDEDDALWVADAGGSGVLQLDPNGEVSAKIELGMPAFACTVGDGTLFVCVAPDHHEHARKATREGSILAIALA